MIRCPNPKCRQPGHEFPVRLEQLGCDNDACNVFLFKRDATTEDYENAVVAQKRATVEADPTKANFFAVDVPDAKVVLWSR